MPSYPDPTLVAIPAFIFFVALEWWAVAKRHATGNYDVKDAFTSMIMGLGSSISGVLFGYLAYSATLWVWGNFRITDIALTWWSFIGLMLLNDFLYYWKHRAMHRIRWFWANHIVHHSSEHYNLTTALRQPWTGPITGLFVIGLPQVVLGFHPAAVAFAGGINLLYQFWIHTEAIDRTPRWFEATFNTPSHHRVHHARNPRYLDANYAGILIIWDRMFGTFVPELERDKPDYGLVSPQNSFNPVIIAFQEYWALLRDLFRDGWRVWRWPARFLAPPGWSPDGKHASSKGMKEQFLSQYPAEAGTPGLRVKSRRKQLGKVPAE
ncbi:MAG: sterol desaturase family protein [Pseudomonadota bacterium]